MTNNVEDAAAPQPGRVALAYASVTVLFWASAFPAIRAALTAFTPTELAALRFVVASAALGLYVAWTRPALPGRQDWLRIAAAGGLGIAAYNLLLNTGQQVVDAATASLIVNTAPVFTAILGSTLLGERLRPLGWAGIALSFGGVALIALGRGDASFGEGAFLVLGAAVCQAIQFVLQKPLLARLGPLPVTAAVLWSGTALLLPFLPNALGAALDTPLYALATVLYLGLGPAALAYVTWAHALARMPVSRAASLLYLVPVVASLIAWIWLGEVPGPNTILGGITALAGVLIVNTVGRAPKQAKTG